jgi:hypothetical protein
MCSLGFKDLWVPRVFSPEALGVVDYPAILTSSQPGATRKRGLLLGHSPERYQVHSPPQYFLFPEKLDSSQKMGAP